jgi:hypothetical protein
VCTACVSRFVSNIKIHKPAGIFLAFFLAFLSWFLLHDFDDTNQSNIANMSTECSCQSAVDFDEKYKCDLKRRTERLCSAALGSGDPCEKGIGEQNEAFCNVHLKLERIHAWFLVHNRNNDRIGRHLICSACVDQNELKPAVRRVNGKIARLPAESDYATLDIDGGQADVLKSALPNGARVNQRVKSVPLHATMRAESLSQLAAMMVPYLPTLLSMTRQKKDGMGIHESDLRARAFFFALAFNPRVHRRVRLMDGHGRFLFLFLLEMVRIHGSAVVDSLTIEWVDIDPGVVEWHQLTFACKGLVCLKEDIMRHDPSPERLVCMNFCGFGGSLDNVLEYCRRETSLLMVCYHTRGKNNINTWRRLLKATGGGMQWRLLQTERADFKSYVLFSTAEGDRVLPSGRALREHLEEQEAPPTTPLVLPVQTEWGTSHPARHQTERVPWSKVEKQWLVDCFAANPRLKSARAYSADLLEILRAADAEIKAAFHPFHVDRDKLAGKVRELKLR